MLQEVAGAGGDDEYAVADDDAAWQAVLGKTKGRQYSSFRLHSQEAPGLALCPAAPYAPLLLYSLTLNP